MAFIKTLMNLDQIYSYLLKMNLKLCTGLIDIFSYQRTLGFVRRTHLRLTLFMRGDVSSVSQKLLTTSLLDIFRHFYPQADLESGQLTA